MKILVVGAGAWGKNIIRVCHDLKVLGGIHDVDEKRRKQMYKQYGSPPAWILGSSVPSFKYFADAVIIATPPSTHYEIAIQALHAGKHVLIEKPMAMTSNEGKMLTDTAKTKGLTLMVGHLMRYHAAFIQLQYFITSGIIGKIRYIYSNRLNDGKVRKDENVLWSFAPHDISMILALTGEEPSRITAEGGSWVTPGVHDVTMTHLEFPSGIKAHIHVNWLHPYKEQVLVVLGDEGTAVLDDSQTWDSKLSLDGRPVNIEYEEPLKKEIEHFINCIETGRLPVTDGEEGVRVLKVLEAAQRSLVKDDTELGSCIPTKKFFTAPTAVVEPDAKVGQGTKIWHNSRVLPGSVIGRNGTIGTNVQIGPDVTIGDNVKIQNNVSVYKGVTIEDDVFIGPSVVFTNVKRPRADKQGIFEDTLVCRGASIGANATIICGVTIGIRALVGAGSVVTKDVPSNRIVVGNPAVYYGVINDDKIIKKSA